MANGHPVTLVEVPRSENVLQIKKRDATHKWIERVLNDLGTPERRRKKFSFRSLPACLREYNQQVEDALRTINDNNGKEQLNKYEIEQADEEEQWSDIEVNARNLLNHLCRKFPKQFRVVAVENSLDVLKKPMDAYATFAILSDANPSDNLTMQHSPPKMWSFLQQERKGRVECQGSGGSPYILH